MRKMQDEEIMQGVETPKALSPKIIEMLRATNNPEIQLKTACAVRTLSRSADKTLIQELIGAGIIGVLANLLADNSRTALQIEVVSTLSNIAATSDAKPVTDSGVVPVLISLISSPHDELREKAMDALGNIAADSTQLRDLVLSHGVIAPLAAELESATSTAILHSGSFLLSTLSDKKPKHDFNSFCPLLGVLTLKLFVHADNDVVKYACKAISNLADGPNYKIQAIIETGIVPRLVDLLLSPEQPIQAAAIQAVGHIATGDENQTQSLINCRVSKNLHAILTNTKDEDTIKECLWIISNITAGNRAQITDIFDAGLIPLVNPHLSSPQEKIRIEAVWAIGNAISGASTEQIQALVQLGVIVPLCKLLTDEHRVVTVALEALREVSSLNKFCYYVVPVTRKILRTGQRLSYVIRNYDNIRENPFVDVIRDNALSALENIAAGGSTDMREKAIDILEVYLYEEIDGTVHA